MLFIKTINVQILEIVVRLFQKIKINKSKTIFYTLKAPNSKNFINTSGSSFFYFGESSNYLKTLNI